MEKFREDSLGLRSPNVDTSKKPALRLKFSISILEYILL